MIERKPRTFTGSTENGYKLVAGKVRNKTKPHAQAHTCTGTWAKLGTDITEQAQYRWEEYNNSIKQTVQSRSQNKNRNGVLWVLLCCSQAVCLDISLYICYSLTRKHNDKVTLESIHLTAAHVLSQMLISHERHYIFSASKTPAIVISHPLAIMEL